jgi:UDP-2-acetamido-3-amino-2,3-dideoxy-glucuronate N-acetyltransferase
MALSLPTHSAHPSALVETERVGADTRIWAYCHILHGAVIGRDCSIGDHCYIEGGVTIGDEVVIKNGVAIWQGITIEDRVFVGPNVAFTNDLVPRAKIFRAEYDRTLIREGASLGANSTLVCGITIGRFALVGAGAVVTRDVPDFGLVLGNPARLRGFVCCCGQRLTFSAGPATCSCQRRYHRDSDRVEEIA